MAVRIELWIEGRLVNGAEQWWDDIEASLPDVEWKARFPMLSRVDPYGVVSFERKEMDALGADVRRFLPQAPERVRPFLQRLADLCDEGRLGKVSELRFLGD
ncbi:hypothetical protein [Kribbella sp. NPDC004536]|uniref:hypothetical protein n=1 Tax=Kribbella sp. NPDC004536 TaxID=3364106 RepID=UPI0036CE3BEE